MKRFTAATLFMTQCLAFATGMAAAQTTQRHVGSGTWSSQTYVSSPGSLRGDLARVDEGSFVPGVGEAMDVALLFDGDAAWWERGLAGVSLGASITTAGAAPNYGSVRGAIVLGRWSDDFQGVAKAIGARGLDIHQALWDGLSDSARWALNKNVLDEAIEAGDEILLATRVGDFKEIEKNLTFQKELFYLGTKGYAPSADGTRLVRDTSLW